MSTPPSTAAAEAAQTDWVSAAAITAQRANAPTAKADEREEDRRGRKVSVGYRRFRLIGTRVRNCSAHQPTAPGDQVIHSVFLLHARHGLLCRWTDRWSRWFLRRACYLIRSGIDSTTMLRRPLGETLVHAPCDVAGTGGPADKRGEAHSHLVADGDGRRLMSVDARGEQVDLLMTRDSIASATSGASVRALSQSTRAPSI